MLRPTGRTWILITAGVIAGGMVHIAAVLAFPRLAADRMMAPLLETTRLNEMVVLPPITPETQVLPYMAPDVRYALCRYDLSGGALAVKTALSEASWSIAIYDLAGRTVYAVNGADLEQREVEMLVTRSEGEEVGAIPLAKDRPASTISVTVPGATGLLVIRAPVQSSAYEGFVEREMRQMSCALRPSGRGSAVEPTPAAPASEGESESQ
jgi:uncharacterized membrane protein